MSIALSHTKIEFWEYVSRCHTRHMCEVYGEQMISALKWYEVGASIQRMSYGNYGIWQLRRNIMQGTKLQFQQRVLFHYNLCSFAGQPLHLLVKYCFFVSLISLLVLTLS